MYNRRAISASTPRRRRRAAALLYVLIAFPVFIAFCGLAVDVGRARVARQEIQAVADAAARYAARGMQTSATPLATARAHATAVAAESSVDASAPTRDPNDVVRGTFNPTTKVFAPDPDGDAVLITVRQTLNRPGAPPLFMSLLNGNQPATVRASAVARVVRVSTELQPPAGGNLWLSGMPDNTVHQNFRPDNSTVWDNAGTASTPKQRPLAVGLSSMNLKPGDAISLEGLSGSASWQSGSSGATTGADGDGSYLVANGLAPAGYLPSNNANGMSNTRAPIGAVMAVFLSDDAPTASAAPPNLDFGNPANRDYASIKPQLKQVFFIGDGKRANGESQSIVIPAGATRVFFGMMDAWQWNDNAGNFKANLYATSAIHLVK
jgi:Flp pilus assembly protein TadG